MDRTDHNIDRGPGHFIRPALCCNPGPATSLAACVSDRDGFWFRDTPGFSCFPFDTQSQDFARRCAPFQR